MKYLLLLPLIMVLFNSCDKYKDCVECRTITHTYTIATKKTVETVKSHYECDKTNEELQAMFKYYTYTENGRTYTVYENQCNMNRD